MTRIRSMYSIRFGPAAVALACLAAAGLAQAREVHWSISMAVPGVVLDVGPPAPVYMGPPVYMTPPVYAGPPVYVGPPMYMAPPVYLVSPPAVHYMPPRLIHYSAPPVYYVPAPMPYYPGHGYGPYRHGPVGCADRQAGPWW